jgi:heat shock protein HslJ
MGTAMACPESIMNQETEYLKALQVAESYKIEGNQLQITSSDKVLNFKLK